MNCSASNPRELDEALHEVRRAHGGRTAHAGVEAAGGDDGFSLVELLIVIVVLGILATVVVLSVRGVVDRGDESSDDIDERSLVTALEAYYARNGVYASEAELVAGDFLRRESDRHDITLTPDRTDYAINVQP